MNNRFDDFRVVRVWRGLNRAAQLALATALVCGLLFLASQPNFYFRRDISASRTYTLSPETLAQLRGIAEKASAAKEPPPPIEVFLTLPETVAGEGEEVEKMREVLGILNPRIESLIETFSYEISHGTRMTFSVRKADQMLHAKDYNDLSAALREQGGQMTRFTSLVVRCGDKVSGIEAKSLLAQSGPGQDARIDRFKGEAALLSALLDVTDFRRPVVYYTTNHGELIPSGKNPLSADAQFIAELRSRRYDVRPLNLETDAPADVPADADMIVVAGARLRFTPRETDVLRRYMKSARNGRMLVMLNPLVPTGLDDLFRAWGVKAPGALVVETDSKLRTAEGDTLVGTRYEANQSHPAMRSFFEMGAPMVAGTLAPLQADRSEAKDDDTLDVQQLLYTSQSASWGEWDIGTVPHYDPEKGDIAPPVCVLMACERAVRVNGESKIPGGRLFVIGTADVAADARFDKNGNRQLLIGATNWLTGREYLVNVPARPLSVFRVNATLDDLVGLAKRYALIPLAIALLGVVVSWWRRRA